MGFKARKKPESVFVGHHSDVADGYDSGPSPWTDRRFYVHPERPAAREVWLSRDDGFPLVSVWTQRPNLVPHKGDHFWDIPGECGGILGAEELDIDVPTDRPIKVRLRVEVIE